MADQVIPKAGEGAAKGYMVGGAWGAVIGGIVGTIGGIFSNQAAKYKRKATREEQKVVEIKQATERRQLIRQMFLARSQALAAGTSEQGGAESSATQGSLSSIGTQGIFNLKYFDALVARQIMQKYYLKKAGKAEANAGVIDSIMDMGSAMGGAMGGGMGGGSSSGAASGATEAGISSSYTSGSSGMWNA